MRSTSHALLLTFASFVAIATCGCGSERGDPPFAAGVPPIGGKDKRIRDVADPSLPGHADALASPQEVSGAIVVAVDGYDETHDGKGAGTLYVQDIDATNATPYAGISLYAPTFNPGDLRVGAGDVLDLRGDYQENTKIGTNATFAPGAVLPQIALPVATFRYETTIPAPIDIDVADLADYAKARRWLGMLVRVTNVTLQSDATAATSGRVAVDLSARVADAPTTCDAPFPKPASLTNDLFALEDMNLTRGQNLKSVIGIVSFFCNVKIAPRSPADIQL